MCLLRQCFFPQNLYSFNATGYVIVSILTFISLNHYQVMRVVKIYHVPSTCKTYNRLSSRIVVVQLLSCVQLFAIPWSAAHQASLSFTIFPEFAQTDVHWVGDAIQPSHPLSPSSPPALNLPQHQGLFQWVSSSHQVIRILKFQLQHQSFWWIFRVDFLLK